MSIKSFFGNWIVKNLLLAVIIVAVLIAAANFLLKGITRHNEEIRVPDFSNMTVSEAQTAAAAAAVPPPPRPGWVSEKDAAAPKLSEIDVNFKY